MPHASAFSGSAFRSAIMVLVVAAIVLSGAGWLILSMTRNALEGQLQARILEDFDLLGDAFAEDGEVGLVQFISSATATRSDKQYAFGMFAKDGTYMTGNIMTLPAATGWEVVGESSGQPVGEAGFLEYSKNIGDHLVVVGRSLDVVMATIGAIVSAMIISGIVVALSAVGIGVFLSRGVSVKLEAMAKTLDEVSRGNTDIRLPVGTANDQVDAVSRQMNIHLDRLSELMANMRNTIIAIAHDLKTPLHRVFILLQAAADNDNPEQTSQMLSKAEVEMDRLREVLDTVLRISRIESSDDRSSFAVFSATALLADMAETFEPVIEEAGQSLRVVSAATDEVQLFGDRRMVQQMLVNLIENASRYGGEGAAIQLRAGCETGAAIIEVADNGPGIPSDQRSLVLQPFHQLRSEQAASGTGLGLALVNAVAVRHHAQLELLDNNPGLLVRVKFPAGTP